MDGNRPSFVKNNESNKSAMLCFVSHCSLSRHDLLEKWCISAKNLSLELLALSGIHLVCPFSLIALTAFSERPKMVPVSICLHPISFSIDRLCISYSLGRLSVFKLLRQRGSLGFRLYFKLVVYFRDENASQFCNIWFDSLQQCLGSSAGCFSYWNCDSLTWIFNSSSDSRGPWIWSRSKRCGH